MKGFEHLASLFGLCLDFFWDDDCPNEMTGWSALTVVVWPRDVGGWNRLLEGINQKEA